MARLAQDLGYRRSSQQHPEQKARTSEDDEYSILDENILDPNSPDMTANHGHRRESFADSVSPFSPSDAEWSGYQYGAEQVMHSTTNNTLNTFHERGNILYSRPATSQTGAYPSQVSTWHVGANSGSCTPTVAYEAFGHEYDNSMAPSYSNGAVQPIQPTSYEGLQPRTAAPVFHPTNSLSTSPQSTKDWMSASSSEQLELRVISKNIDPHSPPCHAASPLMRRDGIRKKNARFEIPAERNLRTIDHLINQTNDEHEIKELKQQKRLLRNRQAALDSRQRKKQHTERLEEEKKHFTSIISELEEALGEMKVREVEWIQEREGLASTQQQYKHYVDSIVAEKEELVRCHTIETGELRKKNAFLTDQLQRLESTAMSAAPSSTGFSADFSDFDHLTMSSSPWESFSLTNDFSLETDRPNQESFVVSPKKERPSVKDDEGSATSGLLLMLLLCGAWVASQSATNPAVPMPRMPDDLRAASVTVLNHIYKDAGVHLADTPSGRPTVAVKRSPAEKSRKTTLSASEIASLSHSPLTSLHHRLTTPSEEQQREQTFSLSAKQYNGLSSDDILENEIRHVPAQRRNLGEALTALQRDNPGRAAETYTRSLMLEKVPAEVVRDFARMVSEGAANPMTSEPLS